MASNNVVDALSRLLNGYDVAAMSAALGDELADEVLGRYREQATFDRIGLAQLLGAAASRGVARFVQSAALEADLAGPDEATAALEAVMVTVGAALDLICVDPESASQAERAAAATRGVHLLAQLRSSWVRRGTD